MTKGSFIVAYIRQLQMFSVPVIKAVTTHEPIKKKGNSIKDGQLHNGR